MDDWVTPLADALSEMFNSKGTNNNKKRYQLIVSKEHKGNGLEGSGCSHQGSGAEEYARGVVRSQQHGVKKLPIAHRLRGWGFVALEEWPRVRARRARRAKVIEDSSKPFAVVRCLQQRAPLAPRRTAPIRSSRG
jgi:hypothetical protein